MANPEHVELVKQGAEAIARWRQQHLGERLDLYSAELINFNLRGADLSWAQLNGAQLIDADLRGANLSVANLGWANLSGAKLDLATLTSATLMGADLRGADLGGAVLKRTDLASADFTQTVCSYTVFADCNLHAVKGLETVIHQGPSSIGIDTVIASFQGAGNRLTPELEVFFRGAGVPKELLDSLPHILAEVKYCFCFICYGEPDLGFAEKLKKDLEARGVYCWLYSMDATPGERTWMEIGYKRREAEKTVVLCSAKALIRKGLKKEIEEQLDEDPGKLVPISLDDLWKEPGFPIMGPTRDLQPFLLERNYADFANLPYEQALERLLKGLELKHEPQGDAP